MSRLLLEHLEVLTTLQTVEASLQECPGLSTEILMEDPKDIVHQIAVGWEGPPPHLPEEWMDPSWLECHDTYLTFSGKVWDEVKCSELPRYFNALTLLTTPEVPNNACIYYLASYMYCLVMHDDSQEFEVVSVGNFLECAVHDPERFVFSIPQRHAIISFLNYKQARFEDYDYDVVGFRQRLLASLP